MGRIVFFCIPAWGHTNPTVEVVRQLTEMGHRVRYYSFEPFREKLEAAGAEVILCDAYLPPKPEDLEDKVGKDFAALIAATRDYFEEKGIPFYQKMRHTGYLRHLLVRKAVKTGQILVSLVLGPLTSAVG